MNESKLTSLQVMELKETDDTARQTEARKVLNGGLKHKWKVRGEPFSRHLGKFIDGDQKENTWKKRVKEKQQKMATRAAEKEMKEQRADVRRKKAERSRKNAERKNENQIKSANVQVIKNTSKIRKWNKKAKRQLLKMSSEMIEKLYGKKV